MSEEIKMPNNVITRRSMVAGLAGLAAATLIPGCAPSTAGSAASSAAAAEASASASAAEAAPAAAAGPVEKSTRVCDILGIEKPVIQASMSGLTSPELAAAVSNAGGLGIIGDVDAEKIAATKALTDKPFGVTTYVWSPDLLKTLQDEGCTIAFVLGMGSVETGNVVDTATIKTLKDNGFTVIYRDVNTTVPMLQEAEAAGADILIASGYGQGGHATETRITLPSMLIEARAAISAPLMASGGMVDAATAAAAAALGAEGAYVGTRFNASVESPVSDAAKQAIVDTRAEDLVEWRGILGFVRATPGSLADKCIKMDKQDATRDELSAVYQETWVKGMLEGDLKNWAVSMNDAVNSITSILPAADIVNEIAAGFGY